MGASSSFVLSVFKARESYECMRGWMGCTWEDKGIMKGMDGIVH